MDYYKRALELNDETIKNRRYFHMNAETGLHMPMACAYVMDKLTEYGLAPSRCGEGVTATVGNGGKVLLLRADMDALPMPEESGLPFACPTGKEAHTCGHDFHASMLLTAAKMLKENEAELKGTVKFMFQPAEETFEGSKNMVGIYMYNSTGTMMYSVDGFHIEIKGKGSHGAYPQNSIDPINIAAHVYLALQSVIAREVDPSKACLMTVGKFHAGTAANIIPDTAVLEGTIRTNDKDSRELLVRRMKEMAIRTAETFGGTAKVTMISEVPPLICDTEFTEQIVGFMKELDIPELTPYPGISASASEDFANIAERIPSAFMYLSAGYIDDRGKYSAHNPKVQFNEDVCPIGAACLAHCATRYLN